MEKCPICLNILNDETITITNCNHTICDTCINKSIDTNGVRCPLCRSSIKEFYNKNERTKIIIKTIERRLNNNILLQYHDLYMKYKLRCYLLLIILIPQFYLIFQDQYKIKLYSNLFETCQTNNTNLINNYNDCMEEIQIGSRTEGVYIYNEFKKVLMLCQLPLLYLNKCY